MQKSSRNRKSPSNRGGHGKVGQAAKPAKATSHSARKPAGPCPPHKLGSTAKNGAIRFAAKGNKQAALLDLLKRPAGAAIAALMDASGWQQHSVRGFLAGVVRKKLGLELVSAAEDGQRIYRIVAPKQA